MLLTHIEAFFSQKYALFSNHCPLLPNCFLRLKEDNNRSVAAFPLVSRAAGKLDVRAGCVCGERCTGPRTQQTLPRLEQNTGGHFVIRLVSIVESASEDGRCNISRSNLIW